MLEYKKNRLQIMNEFCLLRNHGESRTHNNNLFHLFNHLWQIAWKFKVSQSHQNPYWKPSNFKLTVISVRYLRKTKILKLQNDVSILAHYRERGWNYNYPISVQMPWMVCGLNKRLEQKSIEATIFPYFDPTLHIRYEYRTFLSGFLFWKHSI